MPAAERERLMFRGALPLALTPSIFQEALGVEKYRAHLNFFYGVVVEEALWQAVEGEVLKERGVRGLQHPHGVFDLVCQRLYRMDLMPGHQSTLILSFLTIKPIQRWNG